MQHEGYNGVLNGRDNKFESCFGGMNGITTITIPVRKNGWLATGILDNGLCFTVIDFDADEGTKLDPAVLPPFFRKTMLVRTGSGGIHAYFLVSEPIRNTQTVHISKVKGATRVDRRGVGNPSKVIAPGTVFTRGYDHKKKVFFTFPSPAIYEIINDLPLLEITGAEFWTAWASVATKVVKPARKVLAVAPKRLLAPGKPGEKAAKRDVPEAPIEIPIEVVDEHFPPCINAAMTKCSHGIHLSHAERFFLAAFLARIGAVDPFSKWNERAIVEIFHDQDDFDRAFTAYQVHQIDAVGYFPYGCAELQGMGMCYACGPGCSSLFTVTVINPLDYYSLKATGTIGRRR